MPRNEHERDNQASTGQNEKERGETRKSKPKLERARPNEKERDNTRKSIPK